jgi:hypothetical protein
VAHLRRQGLLARSRLSLRRAPLRRSHGRLARGEIEEEQRTRGDLAALENGLNTMEEVKACRAWRKALHRAKTEDRDEAAEAERLRQDLLRRFNALNKTAQYERRQKELSVAEGEATKEEGNY